MNLKEESNFSHDVQRTIETAPEFKNNGDNSIGKKNGASNEESEEFSQEMISSLKNSPQRSQKKRNIINNEVIRLERVPRQ